MQYHRYAILGSLNGGEAMGGAMEQNGWPHRAALIVSAEAACDRGLPEMARLCGLKPLAAGEDEWPLADILIADLRSAPSRLDDIARYVQQRPVPVLAWTDLPGLDASYSALAHTEPYWLVDGSEYEALAMLTMIAHRPKPSALHENDNTPDYSALHRMSNELADFAHLLANIAGQGQPATVKTRSLLHHEIDRSAPLDPAYIRELLRKRRLRDSYFQPGLFSDPAWDILLDLMAAKLECHDVSVSSLCIAAAVPPTTALRCITAMTRDGLLERTPDPHDARRIFMSLSLRAEAAMHRYLTETLPTGAT